MTAGSSMTCARYARAVERRWRALHGAPVVLSPKDWTVLRGWYELGVPLALVDESIEALREGRRRGFPRSLAHIDAAVRAGWATVRGGRSAPPERPPGHGAAPALRAWHRARGGTAVGSLIERLARRAAAGEDPATLDRVLDRELPACCPPDLLAEVEREVDRELAPYRDRMDCGALRTSRRRGIVGRLRTRLELPRLG